MHGGRPLHGRRGTIARRKTIARGLVIDQDTGTICTGTAHCTETMSARRTIIIPPPSPVHPPIPNKHTPHFHRTRRHLYPSYKTDTHTPHSHLDASPKMRNNLILPTSLLLLLFPHQTAAVALTLLLLQLVLLLPHPHRHHARHRRILRTWIARLAQLILLAAGGVLCVVWGVDGLLWGVRWIRGMEWVRRGGRTAEVVFCVGMVVLLVGKVSLLSPRSPVVGDLMVVFMI